jgi:ferredoxin
MTDRVREEPALLPQLDAAHCVHSIIEAAACRACVDVCPQQAWRLDDEALGLVVAACDGCGLCVPTCPQQAIKFPIEFGYRRIANAHAVLAACEKANVKPGAGTIGCLSAIGLNDLLAHYQDGRQVWLLAHGDCATCPRGQAESVFHRVEQLNTALRQRGRPVIVLRIVSSASWDRLSAETDSDTLSTRRSFLRNLAHNPGALVSTTNTAAPEAKLTAPGECLPGGDDALLPWVVEFDAQCCIGCDACAKVCPQDAIHLNDIPPAYVLRHRACHNATVCRC